jgi:hypothetical protein
VRDITQREFLRTRFDLVLILRALVVDQRKRDRSEERKKYQGSDTAFSQAALSVRHAAGKSSFQAHNRVLCNRASGVSHSQLMDCANGFFFIFDFLSRTNRRRRLNTRRRRQKYNAPILSGNVLNNAGAPLPSSDDNRRVFPRWRDFLPTVYQNNDVRQC